MLTTKLKMPNPWIWEGGYAAPGHDLGIGQPQQTMTNPMRVWNE
jgi:hypothetical protein